MRSDHLNKHAKTHQKPEGAEEEESGEAQSPNSESSSSEIMAADSTEPGYSMTQEVVEMQPDVMQQQQYEQQGVVLTQDHVIAQQQQQMQHQQMQQQQMQQQMQQQQQQVQVGDSISLTGAPILGMVELSRPPVLTHLPQQIIRTYEHPLYPTGLAALPPTGAELQQEAGNEYVILQTYSSPSGSMVQCPVAIHPSSHVPPIQGSSEFGPGDIPPPNVSIYPS